MKFNVLRSLALAAFGGFVACAAGTDVNGSSALRGDAGGTDDGGYTPTGDDDAAPVGDDDASVPPPDDAGTPPKDSGGASRKDSGGGGTPDTGGGGTPDTGGGGTPDTGGGVTCSTLPAAVQSGVAACDTCMATNCCATITDCIVDSPACLAIYECTQNCDNGTYPDGGAFDSTNTADVDACWNTCEAGQSTATLFESEDNCVSTNCTTPCMLN